VRAYKGVRGGCEKQGEGWQSQPGGDDRKETSKAATGGPVLAVRGRIGE